MTQRTLLTGFVPDIEGADMRVMNVQTIRSWRKITTDFLCDTALLVVWIATLWMIVMDVLVV